MGAKGASSTEKLGPEKKKTFNFWSAATSLFKVKMEGDVGTWSCLHEKWMNFYETTINALKISSPFYLVLP